CALGQRRRERPMRRGLQSRSQGDRLLDLAPSQREKERIDDSTTFVGNVKPPDRSHKGRVVGACGNTDATPTTERSTAPMSSASVLAVTTALRFSLRQRTYASFRRPSAPVSLPHSRRRRSSPSA